MISFNGDGKQYTNFVGFITVTVLILKGNIKSVKVWIFLPCNNPEDSDHRLPFQPFTEVDMALAFIFVFGVALSDANLRLSKYHATS